jgi:hypothetical protein
MNFNFNFRDDRPVQDVNNLNPRNNMKTLMFYCFYGFVIPAIISVLTVIRMNSLVWIFDMYLAGIKILSACFFVMTFIRYYYKTKNPVLSLNQSPHQMRRSAR